MKQKLFLLNDTRNSKSAQDVASTLAQQRTVAGLPLRL